MKLQDIASTVSFDLPVQGHGRVCIDGRPVSFVRSVTIEPGDPGRMAKVVLTFNANVRGAAVAPPEPSAES